MTNNKNTFLLIALILLIPLLGSCQNSGNNNSTSQVAIPSQPSATPTQDRDQNLLALSQICTNNQLGYQVNYPRGWQSNPAEVLDNCQVFDPESATVPANTESTDKAIYLRVETNTPFDLVAQENLGEKHLSNHNLTIQGYQAVAIESESTGQGLLSEGVRTYSYIVNLDQGTMIAITYDLPGNNYQQNKQVLDRMMETIEFKKQLTKK